MTSFSQRKSNSSSSINNFLDKVVLHAEKHYIRRIIAGVLSLIWFPLIIAYLGESLQMVNSTNKRLNLFGFVLTAIVYIYAAITVIYTYYKPKQESKEANLQGSLNIDDEIFKAYHNYYDEKYNKLISVIDRISADPCSARSDEAMLFSIAHDPNQNMINICRGIRESLCSLTYLQSKQMVVSMAFCIPSISSEWRYVDKGIISSGLELSTLTTNEDTVFYRVLSGKESDFVFENDKIKAAENGGYVFDNRDLNSGKIGSILCMDISIEVMRMKAHLVLSVASYGKRFCDSPDQNLVNEIRLKMDRLILSEFAYLIRLEFASLIIQKIHEGENTDDE